MSSSDARTRGKLVMCYPPSVEEVKEALRKFISTYPAMHELNVEECVYLQGTCPIEYVPANLSATEEYLMENF